jgi:hypothetical protein
VVGEARLLESRSKGWKATRRCFSLDLTPVYLYANREHESSAYLHPITLLPTKASPNGEGK